MVWHNIDWTPALIHVGKSGVTYEQQSKAQKFFWSLVVPVYQHTSMASPANRRLKFAPDRFDSYVKRPLPSPTIRSIASKYFVSLKVNLIY